MLLTALLLGIIESITEFLPISSTAHLIIFNRVFGIAFSDPNFTETFDIFIQSGAVFAVLIVYFKDLFSFTNFHLTFRLYIKIAIAFIPTALFGFFFYKHIKTLMSINTIVISMFTGGIVLMFIDPLQKYFWRGQTAEISDIKWFHTLLIGLFQSLSLIAGVSRSGATIVGGMLVGLYKSQAAKFSFLLAIPTILSATCFELYKNIHFLDANLSSDNIFYLFVGFIVSFFCSIFIINIFLRLIKNLSFFWFGLYRVILSCLIYFVLHSQ